MTDNTIENDLCQCCTLAEIAALPPGAPVTTSALVRAFRLKDERGLKNMVERGELPRPAWMTGRHFWTAGSLVKHWQKLQDEAQTEADEKRRTMQQHSA